MAECIIDCLPDGSSRFIWSDDLVGLASEGTPSIRRASDVEPDDNGWWWADMAKSGGGKLGPYAKRGDALAAEVAWLKHHM